MFGNLENSVAQGADCLKGYAEQFAKDRMQVFPSKSLLPVSREQSLDIARPVR